MVERPSEPGSAEDLWSIGAVTRRSGLTDHTLRAWEKRYGFPSPVRLPSGHRRYPAEQVRRLVLIAQALDRGHRAGDVVPLPLERIVALLHEGAGAGAAPATDGAAWIDTVVDAARSFDGTRLETQLASQAAILGVSRYLRERVVPLLVAVGELWAREEIGVRHEHFISDRLVHQLRELLHVVSPAASGRPVVFAALPGEQHTLGLTLAALEVAAVGRAAKLLGATLPAAEVVAVAEALEARAVGLSISISADVAVATRHVLELRDLLSPEIELWVGGAGSADLPTDRPGLRRFASLDELDAVLVV